jgi:hypothetical protein
MEPTSLKNCRLCLGPHDEEIHEATLRIHTWLRGEITSRIVPWRSLLPIRPPETTDGKLPAPAGS